MSGKLLSSGRFAICRRSRSAEKVPASAGGAETASGSYMGRVVRSGSSTVLYVFVNTERSRFRTHIAAGFHRGNRSIPLRGDMRIDNRQAVGQ